MDEKRIKAEANATPRPPTVHELGGGYYYTCYWLACNEQLKRWWRYCPNCGQRILWEGEDND